MMPDASPAIEQRLAPDFAMPEIRAVEIRRVAFETPKSRYVPSPLKERSDAVAIEVELEKELPARALAPVLHVGGLTLEHSERIGPRRYRFLAFEPEKLAQDAPMSLAWWGDPPDQKVRIRETFRMPEPR